MAVAAITNGAATAAAAVDNGIDLTGRWVLQYSPTGQNPHPYTILLARTVDADCTTAGLASPCWAGPWWNVTAGRTEGRALFTARRAGDHFALDGAEASSTYRYHGTAAPSPTPLFAGTFSNQEGSAPATFTFGRTGYVPGQQAAATPTGSVDMTGHWTLDYAPAGQSAQPYTIELARRADDLCALAFGLAPPCYGGIWFNVNAQRAEGGGYFSAVSTGGQVRLEGADGIDPYTSPQRYHGRGSDNGATALSVSGDFNSDAGTLPARFTLRSTDDLLGSGTTAIQREWLRLGGVRGILGAPTSTAVRVGSTIVRTFRGGTLSFPLGHRSSLPG